MRARACRLQPSWRARCRAADAQSSRDRARRRRGGAAGVYGTGERGRARGRALDRSQLARLLFCAALATEGRAVRLAGWPGPASCCAASPSPTASTAGRRRARRPARGPQPTRAQLARGRPRRRARLRLHLLGRAAAGLARDVLRPRLDLVVFMVSYGTRALRLPMPVRVSRRAARGRDARPAQRAPGADAGAGAAAVLASPRRARPRPRSGRSASGGTRRPTALVAPVRS